VRAAPCLPERLTTMPTTTLDTSEAAELAEILTFIAD
jgi:hypothetical protein